METEFNLVDEPWVPCIRTDGQAEHLSLRDTLIRAHQLREIAGESPLVTAALYRLLLAVLHRVFGPEDHDAWCNLWETGHWDTVQLDTYLEQWQHRFNLFDSEHPFYQVDEPRVRQKPITRISTKDFWKI